MRTVPFTLRLARWLAGGGCLVLGGCMAQAERNLSLLLAPESYDNISVVPYSAVSGLIHFLANLGR